MIINTKNLIKHIKGPYSEYDSDLFENAIYFAEDKKKIIVDGIEYGLDLESDEVDLISNIDFKDNKLTITFSNGKIKEIELEDHRAYWEELPSLEKLFPMSGCIISTHPIKEFTFKGISNSTGKWYSSDGQEGEYNNTDLTTITFKEVGEYTIKFVNNYTGGYNGLINVTDNSVKSALMVGGSNGITEGVIPVNKGENAKLILYNNIISIRDGAFYNCIGFTGELKLPESLTSIGNWAFRNCRGFTSLKLPENVVSIGNNAFQNCSGFTGDLIIPESVTSIESYAFYGCKGLSGELKLPDSLTSIENSAFAYCTGFTSLKLPDSLTSIGDRSFENCTGFTSLKLPESLTSIGDYAFYYCSGFTGELKLPENVVSIGNNAFQNCSGFTGDLIIPESLTSIGDNAFYNCKGLSKIYVCEDTELGNLWNSGTPAEVIKYKKGETPWL